MLLADFLSYTTTVTHDAYVGVPLADLSARGDVLQDVVKRVVEARAGEASADPVPGTTVAGRKRGRKSAPYDLGLGDRRVEVKSAQLKWDKTNKYWKAEWEKVKADKHDDLYLALYTPSGVYVYLHDGVFGVSGKGKAEAASGKPVKAYGPCSVPCIAQATAAVCAKMAHMFVAHLAYE